MCLVCAHGQMSKEDKEKLFEYSRHKTYLHTQDNQVIKLSDTQIDEIIEHALCVVCTGVDMSCDIWAIQWNNDYKVKSFNLINKPVETTKEQPSYFQQAGEFIDSYLKDASEDVKKGILSFANELDIK